MSARIAIIGAGLAGLACAQALRAAGEEVVVFDKGHRTGGRMATRRVDTPQGPASFDHGAQYFTVRDATFAAEMARWRQAGLAAPWPAAGPDAFVGTPGMNSLPAALARGLDVRCGRRVTTLARTEEGWRLAFHPADGSAGEDGGFFRVLLALPAEQAGALLAPIAPELAARAAATPSAPCWTVLAALPLALPTAESCWRHLGGIGWAARNNTKPGRAGPEALVVQAGPDWTHAHLEDAPETIIPALLNGFFEATGLPAQTPLAAHAHRWRYARSGEAGTPCLWQAETGLGLAGDWLLGPRVEAAWLSGRALAKAVLSG